MDDDELLTYLADNFDWLADTLVNLIDNLASNDVDVDTVFLINENYKIKRYALCLSGIPNSYLDITMLETKLVTLLSVVFIYMVVISEASMFLPSPPPPPYLPPHTCMFPHPFSSIPHILTSHYQITWSSF